MTLIPVGVAGSDDRWRAHSRLGRRRVQFVTFAIIGTFAILVLG